MEASTPQGLREQREYIEKLEAEAFGWDLMIGDAFVRGMRDIGYKNTAFALAELIDNAIQASASRVDIIFGLEGGRSKPKQIAVVDNGHGMDPLMVRACLIWGAGTHLNDRGGFGKYGYGLPSASVSQSFRVSVYSKPPDGGWSRCYLDVNEIKDGQWTKGDRIQMPDTEAVDPPQFVVDQLRESGRWEKLKHGTVVVWEELDQNRVDYKQRDKLRANLVTELGVIYRNYLNDTPISVDGVAVEPCDPLFLTEGFRYYDLDDDRAVELDPATVEVKDKETGDVIGKMRVRFARMPATFFRKPEAKRSNKPSRKDMNQRLEIADANNGIMFLRAGRQIDVVRPPRSFTSINVTTDRFWAIDVDFDPALDDWFSITTSKQQVTPDGRIWDMLNDKAKVFTAISSMRTTYEKEAKRIAAETEQAKDGGERASVEAIKGSKKFQTDSPSSDTPERRREADHNLAAETRKRAEKAGVKPEAIRRELVANREGVAYSVETEDMPGAPFYRCVQEGGTRVLYLNVAHRFYTDLYKGPHSTPRLRAGLEVLLWTLGNAEVDADPESDRRQFYERERASVWSARLADSLGVLNKLSAINGESEESEAA